MKNKNTYIYSLGAILIVIAITFFSLHSSKSGEQTYAPTNTSTMEANIGTTTQEVYRTITSAGNEITINNFGEMTLITSPVKLTGTVPTNWIFEGVFKANLYTDKGKLVKEWYGNANIFNEDGTIKDGPVDFEINMEFETPSIEEAETGILRLANDNPSGEAERDDIIEIQVLFE